MSVRIRFSSNAVFPMPVLPDHIEVPAAIAVVDRDRPLIITKRSTTENEIEGIASRSVNLVAVAVP